jgi:DnaJ-class molecular chaperone
VHGCEKTTHTITIVGKCTKCEGTGLDAPNDVVICSTCEGRGMRIQSMGPGMMIQSTCHACLGRGSISKSKKVCSECKGKINIQTEKKFNLKIPKGLANNSVIQLDSSDSYEINARIIYKLDEGVQVQNQDVHIHIPPLSLEELLCGFNRKIDLYGKTITLKTSGYFNPDKPKKLEGRGLPFPNDPSKFGNAIIHYKINYTEMPNLNDHVDDFKKIFTSE